MLGLFLAEYLVGAVLYDFRHGLSLDEGELDALVMLLGNGLVFSVLMHRRGTGYRELFHPPGRSPLAAFVLLVVPILLLVPLLVLSLGFVVEQVEKWLPLSAWERDYFTRMASGTLPAIVASCVLAPVLEEMLFRGVILRSFLAQYPRRQAILGSAVLFGFAHLNVYQFTVALALGVIAGWLFERTRSLVPCITLHAAYNTTLVVLDLQASKAGGADAGPSVAAWVGAGAAFAVGARALYGLVGLRRSG